MGAVIPFRRRTRRRRHVRASAGSRAARAAIVSAVTPASLTTGAAKTALHHSAGIRSRCTHLRAAATPAPISSAMASGEAQSPMIERNEVIAAIESSIGQYVLNCNVKVSHDCGELPGQNCPMGKDDAPTDFKRAFIARVRAAREARPYTQAEVADLLGMSQDRYKQYEGRSYLPHHLVTRFCTACGVDFKWLYTGAGIGPTVIPRPVERRNTAARRGRRTAA